MRIAYMFFLDKLKNKLNVIRFTRTSKTEY